MSNTPLVDDTEVLTTTIDQAVTETATPETDDEVIARLAALNIIDYDRVRKEEAKALGVQVKTLDDLVKAASNADVAVASHPFAESESHPEPINPAQLLDEVSTTILRFVVLDKDQADVAALWVAHTHMTDIFDTSPLAIINAPEKACAKTLFQTVLGRMSYRPLPASNASPSALFRSVELWKPTILFDEADTFFRDNAELHGMVNAGYKRGGFVLRSEAAGDSYEPKMFSVYSAKSLAGIALEKHLPDATMSRGIVFNLRKKLPHESVDRLRYAEPGLFDSIASKLARFAEDYSQQIRLARPALPDALSDRAQDNWEPLLAIAECAGPEWLVRATAAALNLSSASAESVSTGNELLSDIQHVFESKRVDKISTVDLIAALMEINEGPWATYNRGNPISPRQLAKQLSGYGIKSKTVRMKHDTPKGFDTAQFADAFARYLGTPPKVPPQGNDSPKPMPDMASTVADAGRVAATPTETATCDPLALLDCGGVVAESTGLDGADHDSNPSVF